MRVSRRLRSMRQASRRPARASSRIRRLASPREHPSGGGQRGMMRKDAFRVAFASPGQGRSAMRVPNPPAKPLLVFDGDCGFCRTWVARWRRTVGPQVDYEELQTAGARFPTIPRSRFRRSLQLILPDGEGFQDPEAAFRTLAP